jgi:hypothetical protein
LFYILKEILSGIGTDLQSVFSYSKEKIDFTSAKNKYSLDKKDINKQKKELLADKMGKIS